MGGRNNSFVRATGSCASTKGSRNQAEQTTLASGRSSTPGPCAPWHWQSREPQQSCLWTGLLWEDGALVVAPASRLSSVLKFLDGWSGQCRVSIPLACRSGGAILACATCHCIPMTSCSISSASITQFVDLLRTSFSVHRSRRWEKRRVFAEKETRFRCALQPKPAQQVV
jgi:hypothetical protein